MRFREQKPQRRRFWTKICTTNGCELLLVFLSPHEPSESESPIFQISLCDSEKSKAEIADKALKRFPKSAPLWECCLTWKILSSAAEKEVMKTFNSAVKALPEKVRCLVLVAYLCDFLFVFLGDVTIMGTRIELGHYRLSGAGRFHIRGMYCRF